VDNLAQQQHLLESLMPAGFSASEIQGIARDNFMRVFRAVMS
jgi:membrane dipeptidase